MIETIWSADRRVHWPRPTRGFWFVAQAVDLIGRYVFADDWHIEDMNAYRIFPRTKPAFIEGSSGGRSLAPGAAPPQTREQRLQVHDDLCRQIDEENAAAIAHNTAHASAIKRRHHIERIIAAAAADERVGMVYRSLADLSEQPIPASYWATIWWPIVFREGIVPGSSWMREIDQPFTGEVFISEVQVRAVDWKKIQGRVEPEPLSEPSEAVGDAHTPPDRGQSQPIPAAGPALRTKRDTETWYQDRVAAAVAANVRHTRDEDEAAGRLNGIGRDRVRELRRNHAPSEWADGGRPSK